MTRRWSNTYAPHSTCAKCGWTGKDWAFNYQRLCTRCYKQWRKEQAEERRKLKPPDENVHVAAGVVVTRNIRERLRQRARSDVPLRMYWYLARWCEVGGSLLSLIAMLILMFTSQLYPQYAPFLVTCGIVGFGMLFLAKHIQEGEIAKRMPKVNARLEELARERQQKIDEASMFYASAEWRLLRQEVLRDRGRRCEKCRRAIRYDFDLTVDHIKPRSKFPELALHKYNLEALCRGCNSSKGATYGESSIKLETTAAIPTGSDERA